MTTPLRPPAGLIAVLLLAAPAAAQESALEKLLPSDAVAFAHVRVGAVWNSKAFAAYRQALELLGPEELRNFDQKFVPAPSSVETLTIVVPSLDLKSPLPEGRPVGKSALVAVTTKVPLDRAAVAKALAPHLRVKKYRGVEFFFEERGWSGTLFLDDRTLVFGAEDSIYQLIERMEQKPIESPLSAL